MRALLLSLLERFLRFRYAKFGIVGASGTVVNMAVLYVAQEWVFQQIASPRERLYVSLALAILIATVNNFSWNRLWTWADRRASPSASEPGAGADAGPGVAGLFMRYAVASWLGIALQYSLTLWLSQHIHYLVANVLAIVVASVSNFIANDRWTFRRKT